MAVFSNRATLSYNGISTDSNVVTGEIVEALSASKNALITTYTAGDTVSYVISIVNSGALPYTNLSLTDNLGAYTFNTQTLVPLSYVNGSLFYYANGVLSTPPTVTSESPLVISGINVPANGNAILIYSATVNEFAPLSEGSLIVNQAFISGGGITPIPLSDTITAASGVRLSVSKALSPVTVTENEEITYTFTIYNYGNTATTPADDVTLRDVFNPILSNITVNLDGAPLAEGTDYTYEEASGLFQTVTGRITVPAATFTQGAGGEQIITPGVATLTVSGTV